MYKHILVATDGSPLALKATKEATKMAKAMKAKLTAVYVTAPFSPSMTSEGTLARHMDVLQDAYAESTQAAARKALAKSQSTAQAAKVACNRLHVTDASPWEGIIKAAKRHKCDVIVMASHGRGGLTGLLLGSETVKVLAHTKVPVLVVR